MATKEDPKGYYAALGLTPSASANAIKKAYRRGAQETHPDKNPSRDTRAAFQKIGEAYGVLSDPAKRAAYDNSAREMPRAEASQSQQDEPVEPVKCSSCNEISAQPRYVIFYQVVSFFIATQRSGIQGVFCPRCAFKKGLWASTVTWIVGWWAPWGLIWTPWALARNIAGGERPADVNAKLLGYQAWAFARRGQIELGRAIAAAGLRLAVQAKDHAYSGVLGEFLRRTEGAGPVRELDDQWAFPSKAFAGQMTLAGTVVASVLALVYWPHANEQAPAPPRVLRASAPSAPVPTAQWESAAKPTAPKKAVYSRPATAPNGSSWPTSAAYVAGYQALNRNGRSNVTVDNTQNGSDVFVRLMSLETNTPRAVRSVFIPARSQFTIQKIKAGPYDVRYRDLDSGRLSRSDPFTLKEIETDDGIRYSNVSLTLYKVRHGNMRTYDIGEEEFD